MAYSDHSSYTTLPAFAVLVLRIGEHPWTWVLLSPYYWPSLAPHPPLICGVKEFVLGKQMSATPHPGNTHKRRVAHSLTHCGK